MWFLLPLLEMAFVMSLIFYINTFKARVSVCIGLAKKFVLVSLIYVSYTVKTKVASASSATCSLEG